MSETPVLTVQGLHFTYPQTWTGKTSPSDQRALKEISFEVGRGRALGVAGESGAGKSTLARILMGLLAPSAGVVTLSGSSLYQGGRPAREALARIGAVFQDPHSSLNPDMTVLQLVTEPLRIRGDRNDLPGRARRALDAVGMSDSGLDAKASGFSGGERQRISLARALIGEPDLLVADEITSALDAQLGCQIVDLLHELKKTTELSIVLMSHDMDAVERLCDSVAVIWRGQFVECGPTSDVFEAPLHPYSQLLLATAHGDCVTVPADLESLATDSRSRLVEERPGHWARRDCS